MVYYSFTYINDDLSNHLVATILNEQAIPLLQLLYKLNIEVGFTLNLGDPSI